MERKRRERGERRVLLEGVVGRQMGWQYLWLSPAPEIWDLLPTWKPMGDAKLPPAAHHGARALPRASIRLVSLHAKHCSCSIDKGPKSMSWGPPCSNTAGFHGNTSQLPIWRWPRYPQSEENPRSPQAFWTKIPHLFFLKIAC